MRILLILLLSVIITSTSQADLKSADLAYSRGEYEKALKLYLEEAEKGNPNAQFTLGLMYQFGRGTEVNYKEDFRWQKAAADQDFPRSHYQVGLSYLFGRGVKADIHKAIKHFDAGQKLGHANSAARLAQIYAAGKFGIKQDFDKARALHVKAAKQTIYSSVFRLGGMYFSGMGVPTDEYRGMLLILVAANHNDESAKKTIKAFEEELKLPIKEIVAQYYGYSAPLEHIQLCHSPNSKKQNCDVYLSDNP